MREPIGFILWVIFGITACCFGAIQFDNKNISRAIQLWIISIFWLGLAITHYIKM